MQSQQAIQTRTGEATHYSKASTSPKPSRVIHPPRHPLLQLQQAIGNQAVQRLLRSHAVPAKLAVSQPGDIYEQEADRVAEQVMRLPAPALQRACAPCAAGGAPCPKCEGEKRELVQRKTEQVSDTAGVPDNFLQSLGPGQPLDPSARAFFEPRFGHDFSHVRVHTDAKAVESAQEVNALAYTVGRDVFFGVGHYRPQTQEGQRLLAHELTHVIQQQGTPGLAGVQRQQTAASPARTVQQRAQAIITELGPLIMSDQVILDNLRGSGMEEVLRRVDAVSEAGFTYLAWMMKRVDGEEKRTLVDMLLAGTSSADLRGRLVTICARDLYGTEYEDERLLVTLTERMSDTELYQYVVSRGTSTEAIRFMVDDRELRRRVDERIRRYTVAVSRGIEQEAVAELGRIGRERALAEPARGTEIVEAELTLGSDIAQAMEDLRATYEWQSQHEAPTPEARARLHREFRQEIYRLRGAYRDQFEMGLRYGVHFTTGRTGYFYSRQAGVQLYRRRFWSREELARVDSILRRVPRQYLSRIRRIQREPGVGGSAGASWDEPAETLRIFNQGFEIERERFENAVLHEIGHSTMPWRTQGSFRFLPDAAWMQLSDWRTSTRSSLGADVGLSGDDLQDVLQALDQQTRWSAGIHPPIYRNGRAIVPDKYEPNPGVAPNQFLHYDARYDDQFVSPYARRHPAEDFAESFAHFMRNPEDMRPVLDRGRPGVMDKWDFLTQRYPARLTSGR